jgi:hypothetical protein
MGESQFVFDVDYELCELQLKARSPNAMVSVSPAETHRWLLLVGNVGDLSPEISEMCRKV